MSSPTGRSPSEPELQRLYPDTAIGRALRKGTHALDKLPLVDFADLEVRVLAQIGAVRWERSRRGNLWVKLPDATLTVFRAVHKGVWGWRGCIARSAKEGPYFSEIVHGSIDKAKQALLMKYISAGGKLEATVAKPRRSNPKENRRGQHHPARKKR